MYQRQWVLKTFLLQVIQQCFYLLNSTTSKIDTRVRGRLPNIKIENSALNDNWRFGTFQSRCTTRWYEIMNEEALFQEYSTTELYKQYIQILHLIETLIMSQMPVIANDNRK